MREGPVSPDDRQLEALLVEAETQVPVHPQEALRLIEQAGALSRERGNDRIRGQALCLRGAVLFFRGELEEAADAFQEARSIAHALADPALEARATNGLGNVASQRGDYVGTMEFFLESSRLAQAAGDEAGRLRVLNNIGVVRGELGEYHEALSTHREVIEGARRIGETALESSGRANAVLDLCALGEYAQALALADEQLAVLAVSGVRQHEVVVRTYRALSLLELGRLDEALAASEQALPRAEEIAEHDHLCQLLITRGRALYEQGDFRAAAEPLGRALALAGELDYRLHERDAHQVLGDVYEAAGDHPAALRHLRAYLALERRIHAQDVDRRTRLLTAQFQFEALRREAEMERLRSEQLARDNTALRQDRQLLAHRASHDTLTGLANRAHFHAEAGRILRALGGGETGDMAALLFIDLDDFKAVNDAHGHDLGDELLRQVSARLRRHTRREDLVARLGGDEFTVLLPHLRETSDAAAAAEHLLTALCEPYELDEHTVRVTASIGVAIAPRDGDHVTALQKQADAAMYRVKHSSKNGLKLHGDED